MKEEMTYQEKRSIVYTISTLLIIGCYCLYAFHYYPGKTTELPVDFQFWGITFLLMVAAMVVSFIITLIIFSIFNYAKTGEEDPGFTDELDQLIELRSSRNAYNTFTLGFLAAMVAMAFELHPNLMFHLLAATMFAASLMWSGSQFYFYRKGF